MKKIMYRVVGIITVATMLLSSVLAFSAEILPETMIRDGKVYTIDRSAGGGQGTATPDFNIANAVHKAAYKVLGSDVAMYIDYSHGHGGDHFAAGWVRATAPKFTARAEVWANGKLDTTGSNNKNIGDTAEAASYLSVGIVENATPRIFYNW